MAMRLYVVSYLLILIAWSYTPVMNKSRRIWLDGLTPLGLITVAYVSSLAIGYLVYLAVSAWYRAHQSNHFAAHTRFGGATLHGTMTGPGLMLASVKSFLVLVLSLGILAPIAQAILWRYSVANLRIVGEVDLASIAPGAETQFSRGEGLAQAFDFDV